CGGGAEILVREFAKQKRMGSCEFKAVYFNLSSECTKNLNFEENEYTLNVGFRSLKSILAIRNFIREEIENNPSLIVHVHLTWPMLFVSIATLGLGVDLFFTEHATSNGRRKYPFLKYIERLIYSRFKKIICISCCFSGIYILRKP
ncbi:MAG: glycosyltransferase, partial [Campylobacterales bacterium]|nr:glycosyltransferase [Campylobacterales bacterium]